ncbi:hypothetical protein BB559_004120 [Furculomyces boomerangus]|uniref:Uncharacterized protein n=2 Tax=Harpellales TaxID=61421 RepID=A0A2T9YGI5_9FUNG|nr:hypothetical protein BB559_004120 [Furculomyces boomerangus]PWA01517.1 hypothetical protein BB558_002388 [Smittium angustum]
MFRNQQPAKFIANSFSSNTNGKDELTLTNYILSEQKNNPGEIPDLTEFQILKNNTQKPKTILSLGNKDQCDDLNVETDELYYYQVLDSIKNNKNTYINSQNKYNPLFYNKGQEKILSYHGFENNEFFDGN